jgi:hypothetical protein
MSTIPLEQIGLGEGGGVGILPVVKGTGTRDYNSVLMAWLEEYPVGSHNFLNFALNFYNEIISYLQL